MCPYYKVVNNKTSTVLASIQRTEVSIMEEGRDVPSVPGCQITRGHSSKRHVSLSESLSGRISRMLRRHLK